MSDAGVVELVDTRGLEPRALCVRVQVPPPVCSFIACNCDIFKYIC